MTTKEASDEWGVKIRQVQLLCEKGQVKNAKRLGHMWVIPRGTKKPIDGRTRAAKVKVELENLRQEVCYLGAK